MRTNSAKSTVGRQPMESNFAGSPTRRRGSAGRYRLRSMMTCRDRPPCRRIRTPARRTRARNARRRWRQRSRRWRAAAGCGSSRRRNPARTPSPARRRCCRAPARPAVRPQSSRRRRRSAAPRMSPAGEGLVVVENRGADVQPAGTVDGGHLMREGLCRSVRSHGTPGSVLGLRHPRSRPRRSRHSRPGACDRRAALSRSARPPPGA